MAVSPRRALDPGLCRNPACQFPLEEELMSLTLHCTLCSFRTTVQLVERGMI